MSQKWQVVGGADKGGILVRDGETTAAAALGDRLSTGAVVKELQLKSERLQYELIKGSGPKTGWVSVRLPGKDLLVKYDGDDDEEEAAEAQGGSEILEVPGGEITIKAYEDYMKSWNGEIPDIKVHDERPYKEVMQEKLDALNRGEAFPSTYVPDDEVVKLINGGEVPQKDKHLEKYRERSRKNKEAMGELKPLPPYIKFKPGEVRKSALEAKPGEMYGLVVPPTLTDLYKLGEDYLTQAFHAAGTMPKDNRVKKIVEFKRLPMSGQDAAGGSGPKAFITLEYEKEDPGLHKELFVKMPWSVGGESKEMGGDKLWRCKISCNVDNDGQEVTVYRMLGPVFPFHIPKYYFADICRANTNFILITEKLIFGKKGKSEFKPYEIQPLAEKYFDFQLEPRLQSDMYYALVKAQARMAAWDKMGYFDAVPHETRGYHMRGPDYMQPWPRQLGAEKRKELKEQAGMVEACYRDFLQDKAKRCYPECFSDEKFVKALVDAASDSYVWRDDMGVYLSWWPEMVGMMHSNLQSDNAYYWIDEDDKLIAGIIDWGGLAPAHIVHRFQGCITSCLGEVLDEHEDGLIYAFIQEYFMECGILIDFSELRRQWHLTYNSYIYSCGFNILQEVYRQVPKPEWATIDWLMDKRVAGNWNTRCYVFMILHMLKYLWIRWKRSGEGQLHCHKALLEWRDYWCANGLS